MPAVTLKCFVDSLSPLTKMLYPVIGPFCSSASGGIQKRLMDDDDIVRARTFRGGPVGAKKRQRKHLKGDLINRLVYNSLHHFELATGLQ